MNDFCFKQGQCLKASGLHLYPNCPILGDPGADSGDEGKSKRAEKYGPKKSKEGREEPLGTKSYQTSSKRSLLFCLLIGQKTTNKFSGTNQKAERW